MRLCILREPGVNFSFANIRCAIDVLRNRMPGALAMMRATDVSVLVHHSDKAGSKVQVTFWFDNGAAASAAYPACERLYEFNRLDQ